MTPSKPATSLFTARGQWVPALSLSLSLSLSSPAPLTRTHTCTPSLTLSPKIKQNKQKTRNSLPETGEAWLYMPKHPRTSPPPLVLMAHGIGGQKDMGLHPFAEAFVGRGLAALVIDYR